MVFSGGLSSPKERPRGSEDRRRPLGEAIAARRAEQRPAGDAGLLTVGMLSARTTNLSVLASERIAAASTASTYRRLQRFFQFAELGEDWAAPVVAGLARLEGPLTLVLDRTNWKVGRREINLLVLAVATRRHRVGLMWTVLDRAGNSGATERIALIERYIALFGKESIGLLLGDREFIGTEWLNYLMEKDIPFVIRMREGQRATTAEGRSGSLGRLLVGPGGTARRHRHPRRHGARRRARPRRRRPRRPPEGPRAGHRRHQPPGRPRARRLSQALGHRVLLRRRQDPRPQPRGHPPHLPRASSRSSSPSSPSPSPGPAPPPPGSSAARPARKKHGYLAKSVFRIGLDHLRRQLRAGTLSPPTIGPDLARPQVLQSSCSVTRSKGGLTPARQIRVSCP